MWNDSLYPITENLVHPIYFVDDFGSYWFELNVVDALRANISKMRTKFQSTDIFGILKEIWINLNGILTDIDRMKLM